MTLRSPLMCWFQSRPELSIVLRNHLVNPKREEKGRKDKNEVPRRYACEQNQWPNQAKNPVLTRCPQLCTIDRASDLSQTMPNIDHLARSIKQQLLNGVLPFPKKGAERQR